MNTLLRDILVTFKRCETCNSLFYGATYGRLQFGINSKGFGGNRSGAVMFDVKLKRMTKERL